MPFGPRSNNRRLIFTFDGRDFVAPEEIDINQYVSDLDGLADLKTEIEAIFQRFKTNDQRLSDYTIRPGADSVTFEGTELTEDELLKQQSDSDLYVELARRGTGGRSRRKRRKTRRRNRNKRTRK